MDKRDMALHRSCPVLAATKYASLIRNDQCGERVIVAANGIFMEFTEKWGRFVRRVGEINAHVPYGLLRECNELNIPRLPRHLFEQFNRLAVKSAHVEIGASIVWDTVIHAFRLVESKVIEISHDALRYQLGKFNDNEVLVVDCHSHSHHPAFFSPEDNGDDRYAVKFSYVVGNCNQPDLSFAMRLCVKGHFEKINAEKFLQTAECAHSA